MLRSTALVVMLILLLPGLAAQPTIDEIGHLLGFSNIDWGQDILDVDKWLKENPDKRPLVMDLDYFGINGELFNVSTTLPPQFPSGTSIDQVRSTLTEPQWWIISVKRLYNSPDHDGVEYLQQIEPVDKIAYAYHVYYMEPAKNPSYQSNIRREPNSAELEVNRENAAAPPKADDDQG